MRGRATKLRARHHRQDHAASRDDAQCRHPLDINQRPIAQQREAHAFPPKLAVPLVRVGVRGRETGDQGGSGDETCRRADSVDARERDPALPRGADVREPDGQPEHPE